MNKGAKDRYDSLLQYYCRMHEVGIDWRWLKSQMLTESNADPKAVSFAGAMGLFQLMPSTAEELGCSEPFNPEMNIDSSLFYMKYLFGKFNEITNKYERVKFATASYNCGRAYINKALSLARKHEGLPEKFSEWVSAGRPSGEWQKWDTTKSFLWVDECIVNGKHPVASEVTEYVNKINTLYYTFYSSSLIDDTSPMTNL